MNYLNCGNSYCNCKFFFWYNGASLRSRLRGHEPTKVTFQKPRRPRRSEVPAFIRPQVSNRSHRQGRCASTFPSKVLLIFFLIIIMNTGNRGNNRKYMISRSTHGFLIILFDFPCDLYRHGFSVIKYKKPWVVKFLGFLFKKYEYREPIRLQYYEKSKFLILFITHMSHLFLMY